MTGSPNPHHGGKTVQMYFNPNWNPEQYYSAIKPLAILYDQVWIWSPSFEDIEEHLHESPIALFESTDARTNRPILLPAGRKIWFDQPRRGMSESSRIVLQDIATASGGILDSEYETGYQAVESVWRDEGRRAWLAQTASEVKHRFCPSMLSDIERVASERKRSIEWAIANAYVQDYLAIRRLKNPCPLMSTDLAHGYSILAAPTGIDASSREIVGLVEEGFGLPDLPKSLRPADVEEIVKFLVQSETFRWSEVVAFRDKYGQPLKEWIQSVRKANQRPLPDIAVDLFRQVEADTSKATLALVSAFSGLSGLLLGGTAGAGVGGGIGVALGIVIARRYRAAIGPVFAKLTEPPTHEFLLDTAAWKTGSWK
jgi:hypothetical protein